MSSPRFWFAPALAAVFVAAMPVPALSGTRFGGVSITSLDPARVSAAAAPPAPLNGRLSNERTLSRWAYSVAAAPIFAAPAGHSRRVASLHLWTEDGFPEIYLLLASKVDAAGRRWIEVRIPMRPNGRVGWVARDALGDFHATRQELVLNRSRLRMYLFQNGRLRWSAPVGIGKPSTPTPAGHFWLRERFKIASPSSLLYADRVAWRRSRRHPRALRRPEPDSRPPVARLHPHADRRRRLARDSRRARHAAAHHLTGHWSPGGRAPYITSAGKKGAGRSRCETRASPGPRRSPRCCSAPSRNDESAIGASVGGGEPGARRRDHGLGRDLVGCADTRPYLASS